MTIKKIFFAVFILALSLIVYRVLKILEISKKVSTLNNEKCQIIGELNGPEDFHIFKNRYLITISDEQLKLIYLKGLKMENIADGSLYIIDVNAKIAKKVEIDNFPKEISFHPHGIYISNSKLYVINHAYSKGGERVEVFKLKEVNGNLIIKYQRSMLFSNEFLGRLDDLVVFNKNEFLITTYLPYPDLMSGKDHSTMNKLKNLFTLIFGLKKTNLHYCKGVDENNKSIVNCRIVENSSGLMNNGITFDYKDTIYVVDTLMKHLKVYKFDKEVDNIKYVETIEIGYAMDNIYYDKDKHLIYIGIIGKVWDDFAYMEESKRENIIPNNRTLYSGGGTYDVVKKKFELNLMQTQYKGIASFIEFDNKYIAGSWHDKGVLICDK